MSALADYYRRRAPEYERIYHKPERQADLRALRDAVAQTFRGHRVLEVACGTGWWTEVLASTAQSVLATDVNEEVLTLARTKQLDPRIVSFQRCDAFQLQNISGEFDAALAVFWWSHLTRSELLRFLDGLHRRLAPGSKVLFIDNIFVPGSSTPISRRDAEGNTYQQRTLDDGSATEVLKNFPEDEQIAELLRESAENLSIRRLRCYWQTGYVTPKVGKSLN